MRVTVKKWGNSASVRIPSAIMDEAHLHLDDPVDVRVEGDKIVIELIRDPAYDLAQLVDRITSENLHGEADFGPALGKEVF